MHIAGYAVDRNAGDFFRIRALSTYQWMRSEVERENTDRKKKFVVEDYPNHMSVSCWADGRAIIGQVHMSQRPSVNEIRITVFETYLSALSCYRTAVKPRHPGGHWWWRSKTVWAVTTDNIAVVQGKWWSMIQLARKRSRQRRDVNTSPVHLKGDSATAVQRESRSIILLRQSHIFTHNKHEWHRKCTSCKSQSYWCGEGGTRDAEICGLEVQDLRCPVFHSVGLHVWP